MNVTPRLGLPLLMPSQAQKHVTVNESLLRLDALAQLTLTSRTVATAPEVAPEGVVYALPAGAEGVWAGQDNRLAARINGGWEFLSPVAGWRAFVADEMVELVFSGGEWRAPSGAGSGAAGLQTRTEDHVVTAGATSTTSALIPQGAVAFGVTGRVIEPIPGTATAFTIGVAESANRYGSGIGVGVGSWLRGLTGSPLAYWADTPLVLTAEGGSFAGGGALRLVVHFVELAIPE